MPFDRHAQHAYIDRPGMMRTKSKPRRSRRSLTWLGIGTFTCFVVWIFSLVVILFLPFRVTPHVGAAIAIGWGRISYVRFEVPSVEKLKTIEEKEKFQSWTERWLSKQLKKRVEWHSDVPPLRAWLPKLRSPPPSPPPPTTIGERVTIGEKKVILRLPLWIPFVLVMVPTVFCIWRDRRVIPPGHCKKCRYDLEGNVSGICPECGTAWVPQPCSRARLGNHVLPQALFRLLIFLGFPTFCADVKR